MTTPEPLPDLNLEGLRDFLQEVMIEIEELHSAIQEIENAHQQLQILKSKVVAWGSLLNILYQVNNTPPENTTLK